MGLFSLIKKFFLTKEKKMLIIDYLLDIAPDEKERKNTLLCPLSRVMSRRKEINYYG